MIIIELFYKLKSITNSYKMLIPFRKPYLKECDMWISSNRTIFISDYNPENKIFENDLKNVSIILKSLAIHIIQYEGSKWIWRPLAKSYFIISVWYFFANWKLICEMIIGFSNELEGGG